MISVTFPSIISFSKKKKKNHWDINSTARIFPRIESFVEEGEMSNSLKKTVLLSRQYQYNALYLHTASSIVVWSARNSSLVEWQAYAVFGVPGVVYMVHLLEALFSKCRFYSKIFHLNDRYLFHFICNSILSLTFIKI